MVTLKIETKTDSFENAEILVKEALRSIRKGSQAGIIGGGIGECLFEVDLSTAQQSEQSDGAGMPPEFHQKNICGCWHCVKWREQQQPSV